MKLRYTRRALRDLLAIAAYIRPRNPAAASAVQAAIRSSIDLLAHSPGMGRERPALNARSIGVSKYPYTAYYRIEDDEVWVLHIRDNRRKPPTRDELGGT